MSCVLVLCCVCFVSVFGVCIVVVVCVVRVCVECSRKYIDYIYIIYTQ